MDVVESWFQVGYLAIRNFPMFTCGMCVAGCTVCYHASRYTLKIPAFEVVG